MNSSLICFAGLAISSIMSISSVIICFKLLHSPYVLVSDSNTFLAVVTAVFAFLFFKNIKIPYSKVINSIAASTFGVLLSGC